MIKGFVEGLEEMSGDLLGGEVLSRVENSELQC